MIAIQTKYLSATGSRGSRIKAFTCNGHSVTIPYDHALRHEQAHFAAVKALKEKHNLDYWDLEGMRYGAIKDGYVFCFYFATVEG